MVTKKKEFKTLEADEIISRVDNFLDTQKLETSSKYFILKQMTENCWDELKSKPEEKLEDFYDEEDELDFADIDDDEDEELETSDALPKFEEEDLVHDAVETDKIVDSLTADAPPVGFEDVLSDINEEKTVAENKAKKKEEK